MAVIEIAKIGMVKSRRRLHKRGNRLSDARNLQCLLTADAGSHFKIALQCSGADVVHSSILLYGSGAIAIAVLLQNIRYNIHIL